MSLEIRFWNIIVLKKMLEKKYPGGTEQFKHDYPDKPYQEDEYLISFSFMKAYDIDFYIDAFAKKGLDYNKQKGISDDFVVLAFEINGGLWWKADWLNYDSDYCWYNQNYKESKESHNYKRNLDKLFE